MYGSERIADAGKASKPGEMTAEYIRELIMDSAETAADVEQILKANGIEYEQDEYSDYFNVKIFRPDGFIRIYQDYRKNIIVQGWHKETLKQSGIPTFEPSGRTSF